MRATWNHSNIWIDVDNGMHIVGSLYITNFIINDFLDSEQTGGIVFHRVTACNFWNFHYFSVYFLCYVQQVT